MSTLATFYVEAHLDPTNKPDLTSDEAAQRRGWIVDLVGAGIKALQQVSDELRLEGGTASPGG